MHFPIHVTALKSELYSVFSSTPSCPSCGVSSVCASDVLITFFAKAVNIDLDPFCSGPSPSFGRHVCLVTFDAGNFHCCKNLQCQNPKGTRHRLLVQTLSMKTILKVLLSQQVLKTLLTHTIYYCSFVSISSSVGLPFLLGMGGESFHYNSNKIISYLLEV